MAQGCKQVPLEYTKNIVRWAHPDGYFLNAKGQKVAQDFCPAMMRGDGGSKYPKDRTTNKLSHHLMALAFYGERPTYTNLLTGENYVGIVHHLIPDKLDYKPANLLCWLTREQHTEADSRQKELKKILPDMHDLSYDEHRRIQDPRVTSKEQFEVELENLRKRYELQ